MVMDSLKRALARIFARGDDAEEIPKVPTRLEFRIAYAHDPVCSAYTFRLEGHEGVFKHHATLKDIVGHVASSDGDVPPADVQAMLGAIKRTDVWTLSERGSGGRRSETEIDDLNFVIEVKIGPRERMIKFHGGPTVRHEKFVTAMRTGFAGRIEDTLRKRVMKR